MLRYTNTFQREMTTYLQGNLDSCFETIDQWVKSEHEMLILTFPFPDSRDFIKEINNIQEDLGANTWQWPDNVILTTKSIGTNPNHEKMIKWDEKHLRDVGYWFIFGIKVKKDVY